MDETGGLSRLLQQIVWFRFAACIADAWGGVSVSLNPHSISGRYSSSSCFRCNASLFSGILHCVKKLDMCTLRLLVIGHDCILTLDIYEYWCGMWMNDHRLPVCVWIFVDREWAIMVCGIVHHCRHAFRVNETREIYKLIYYRYIFADWPCKSRR